MTAMAGGSDAEGRGGGMDGDAPVVFANVQGLRSWLASWEIPVERWGTGQAKQVTDLWSELGTGESVLTGPPPQRRVAYVSVVVKRGNTTLTEVGQLLADGRTRTRCSPPSEKMHPGEDAEAAAFRCAWEEPGRTRQECRIVASRPAEDSQARESPSYPGLMTLYRETQVEMEIPDLPGAAFGTPESDPAQDATVTIHYWDWRPG